MEEYFEKYDYPFEFEKIDENLYGAEADFIFTEEPLKDVIFVQRYIVTEDIASVCALYADIDDMERFDLLAELFMEQYGILVRYDSDYSAVKVSMVIDKEDFDDEEVDEEDILEYLTTFPALICRMVAYAYFTSDNENITPDDIFNEITENQDDFLIPEEISFEVDNECGIQEGQERYYIEHIFLPALFYNAPAALIEKIQEQPECIELIIENALRENNAAMIPGYSNFQFKTLIENDDCIAVDIVLPNADKYLDCSDIILFCSESKCACYFTVELDFDKTKNTKIYFPCSWNDEGGHSNYGMTRTRDEALKVIKDMIM